MLAQQVAKKYARALFELAREYDILDLAWEQFNALAEYLKKDATFIDFMAAPQIRDQDKEALVRKVFGERLHQTFFNFLLVLVDKKRVKYLPEIISEFDQLVREERGIVRAACITITPLSEGERKQLVGQLVAKTGKTIELEEKIDKSIIGGMIVMLQNEIIDGSLRFAMSQLRNRLMKVKVH